MKKKHLALVLLGWYLLLPPWMKPYPHFNENAPFSEWHSGANKNGKACVFPTFDACAQFKATTMAALKAGDVTFSNTSGLSQAVLLKYNYGLYWNSRCVKQ